MILLRLFINGGFFFLLLSDYVRWPFIVVVVLVVVANCADGPRARPYTNNIEPHTRIARDFIFPSEHQSSAPSDQRGLFETFLLPNYPTVPCHNIILISLL